MPPIHRSNSNIEVMQHNHSNKKERRENVEVNHYHKRSNSQLGGGGKNINSYDVLYNEY